MVIGFAGSFIYQTVTRKDVALSVSLVNAFEMGSGEEHINAFAGYAGIDTDEYDVFVDSTLHIDNENMSQETIASTQKLMVLVAAGEVDVLMSDEAVIEQYAYNESFYDLREVLSPEQLEQYEPYLYYMDQAVAEAISEAQLEPDYDYSTAPERPDPKKPEAMERPVPIGISLVGAKSLNETFIFLNGDGILAVPATSPNLESVPKYVDFVLEQ